MTFPPQVLEHLATADPILHSAILSNNLESRHIVPLLDHSQFFTKLCDSIVSQQLAVKAADAIWARFVALLPDALVTPETVLAIPAQQMRDVGLSWAKVRYVRDLAEQSMLGKISYAAMIEQSDEDVIMELTKVKGIGRWTAEMFLIFTLGRPDVFSHGDLGLLRGFQKLHEIADDGVAKAQLVEAAQKWSPYRSFSALALWSLYDKTK